MDKRMGVHFWLSEEANQAFRGGFPPSFLPYPSVLFPLYALPFKIHVLDSPSVLLDELTAKGRSALYFNLAIWLGLERRRMSDILRRSTQPLQ